MSAPAAVDPERNWWTSPDLWVADEFYHSEVEREAIWNLFRETWSMALRELFGEPQTPIEQSISDVLEPKTPEACPLCGAGARFQHFWRRRPEGDSFICRMCDKVYMFGRGLKGFAPSIRAQAIEMRKAGMKHRIIAAQLHVSVPTLNEWFAAEGLVGKQSEQRQALRAEVLRLHQVGYTHRAIRDATGVSLGSIAAWLAEAGIKNPSLSGVVDRATKRRILKLARAGTGAAEIARQTGVSPKMVGYYIKRAGIVPTRLSPLYDDAIKAEVLELLRAGISKAEIARRTGIVTRTILRWEKEVAGLPHD